MTRYWLSFWALRLASAASFDELVLFQAELRPHAELAVDQQDPLPQSELMPGGVDAGALVKVGDNMMDIVTTFGNDSFWELLEGKLETVVGLWLDAFAKYSSEWRQLSQAGSEMDARSAVAEAIIAFNTSIQSLQEPVTAANEGLGSCQRLNGIAPSCELDPAPVIRFLNYKLRNESKTDFLEDIRLRPNTFTLSEFCSNVTSLARAVATVQSEVAMELEKGAQENSEHGAKDPEMDPLVLMAPDVIGPWRQYRQLRSKKTTKIYRMLQDNNDQWSAFATSMLSEKTGCQMTKESLQSAANSRTPLGLFVVAIVGALWRSARQPPF